MSSYIFRYLFNMILFSVNLFFFYLIGSESTHFPPFTHNVSSVAVGNMLHLIVEACIARNLIDTSAYFWPGYVSSAPSKNSTLVQESPWSVFMEGAQVTDSLKNSLIETPASRFPSPKNPCRLSFICIL